MRIIHVFGHLFLTQQTLHSSGFFAENYRDFIENTGSFESSTFSEEVWILAVFRDVWHLKQSRTELPDTLDLAHFAPIFHLFFLHFLQFPIEKHTENI